MTAFYLYVAAFLLLTLVLGLYRAAMGPTPADRMVGAQLSGTTGIAILLLLSEAMAQPVAIDIAIVFALLAALAVTVFVRCGSGAEP